MRQRGRVVSVAVAVALLAGCTSDVVEQPVEVAPSVIDRRDADEPDGDDPEDVDEVDTADDETEADDPQADDTDDTAASDDDDAADDAPVAAAPPTTSTPTPATPEPATEPTPDPVEPTPDPLVLTAGPAVSSGLTWHSDGTDWAEASSVVLVAGDDDPDPFVVRLQPVADDGRAATRAARCQVTLAAPADRELVVRGEITVAVVIDTADGGTVQRTRQRVHIDAVIAAGEELELPVSTPVQVRLADADRAIDCGADLS